MLMLEPFNDLLPLLLLLMLLLDHEGMEDDMMTD